MVLLNILIWAFLVSLCACVRLYVTISDYQYCCSGGRGKEPVVLGCGMAFCT